MEKQEQPSTNNSGKSFIDVLIELNKTRNDMLNNITSVDGNISNNNVTNRVNLLFGIIKIILENFIERFLSFFSMLMTGVDTFHKEVTENALKYDARLANLEDKVNKMAEQFVPIITERQALDTRLKENSSSMYSGGNKTGTRRRRNANKKRK
jgi:hypothetical protein